MSAGTANMVSFQGLKLVGGHPAINFVNTVKYRGHTEPMDALGSYPRTIDWAAIAHVIDPSEAKLLRNLAESDDRAAGKTYARIEQYREHLRCVLDPANSHSIVMQQASAEALERLIEDQRPLARIQPDAAVLTRSYPIRNLPDLMSRLVQSSIDLMEADPAPRIGLCKASDCDWLFLDRSKARRRHWCDTATCGNLSRVRRFRAKSTRNSPRRERA